MRRTKRQLATSLRSSSEKKEGIDIFISTAWLLRKRAIASRVKRQQDAAHERANTRRRISTNGISNS